MSEIKCVGILTSGGDAPGMNAAIRAVTRSAIFSGLKVKGIYRGYRGLISDEIADFRTQNVSNIIQQGGTILKTARCKEFQTPEGRQLAYDVIRRHEIDALVVIGGDGSLHGAIDLMHAGINVVCIPATIDNDLNFSFSLGYDSATNILVDAIDKISCTLTTFDYGAVIKIMGRECSDLIDCVAEASHTQYVIKHKDFDLEKLTKQIKKQHKESAMPVVVLVLEDCADTIELSKKLEEKCGFAFRPHILGYVQRGGTPSAFDRRYGYTAGIKAIETCFKQTGVCVGLVRDELVTKPITDCFKLGKNA